MNLYQITEEYQAAIDNLQVDEHGEIINFNIDDIAGDLKVKRLAVAAYIKNLQIDYWALNETIRAMSLRQELLFNKVESLKKYLKLSLERTGDKEVKGLEFDIKIKNNPPKLILDEKILVSEHEVWKRTEKWAPDKETIKDLILRGYKIRGAQLVQETRIELK